MGVTKIEHVGVQVSNMERSIHFYQDVIGMDLLDTLVHTNGVIKLAFLGFKGSKETQLELIEGYNDQLPTEGKVHHIAFAVDNLDEEIERLQRHHVQFIDQEITTLPNGARYRFFAGPDGEWIEFFEPAHK